jgi:hypothetical protein
LETTEEETVRTHAIEMAKKVIPAVSIGGIVNYGEYIKCMHDKGIHTYFANRALDALNLRVEDAESGIVQK